MSRLRRLAPLSGIAGIICLLAGFISGSTPTPSWSDAQIQTWYTGHSLGRWMFAAYLIAAGAVLLLIFAGVVRERMTDAGISCTGVSIAHAGALAFAITTLVGAGLYGAIPIAHTFFNAPPPSADVSRYLSGAAYGAVVAFNALGAALLAATMSVMSLRTPATHPRLLPKWLAVLGIPFSLAILANAAIPMFPMALWYAAACATMSLRSKQVATAPVREPVVAD